MTVKLFRWEDIPKEPLNDRLERRIITGEQAMVTQVFMKQGCVVPEHRHINEQLTYIVSGALKFFIEGREIIVRAGEVLRIPSNVPHAAVALEETLDMDIFAPPRQDWLDGTDNYLRNVKHEPEPTLSE